MMLFSHIQIVDSNIDQPHQPNSMTPNGPNFKIIQVRQAGNVFKLTISLFSSQLVHKYGTFDFKFNYKFPPKSQHFG